jgi:heat shock protein HslJ
MTHSLRILAAFAVLGTASPALAQPGGAYRAVGTEPFWSVTIENGRMVYEDAERRRVVARAPVPRPSFNGRRYVTRRLTVEVTRQPCNDGMSDRIYEDRVLVTVNGRTLDGCGGAFAEPSRLANTYWRITAINGRRVPVTGRYQVEFSGDRISGYAGCNSFGGNYRLSGNTLTAGPLTTTRMACGQPAMTHEREALQLLRGPVRVSEPRENAMVLTGRTGSIRLEMVPGARPRR